MEESRRPARSSWQLAHEQTSCNNELSVSVFERVSAYACEELQLCFGRPVGILLKAVQRRHQSFWAPFAIVMATTKDKLLRERCQRQH